MLYQVIRIPRQHICCIMTNTRFIEYPPLVICVSKKKWCRKLCFGRPWPDVVDGGRPSFALCLLRREGGQAIRLRLRLRSRSRSRPKANAAVKGKVKV